MRAAEITVFTITTVMTVAAGAQVVYYALAGRWDGACLAGAALLAGLTAGALVLL